MTDQHDSQHDDELRAALRRVDPASALPPADQAGVARLLEDTMTDEQTRESRTDGARRRGPLTWLVAAAAIVVIGGGIAFAATRGDDTAPVDEAGRAPLAEPADPTTTDAADPEPTVTDLRMEAGATARCVVPDPASEASQELVAGQEIAFAGTAEQVGGRSVTLVPDTWFAGEETDLVTVRQPSEEFSQMLVAVQFEEGQRYLVSATGGQVTLCGFSGEVTPSLERLYERAFA